MFTARAPILRESCSRDKSGRMSLLPPSRQAIARAAELLRAGRLVAFPTETVYGLGADATDERAVAAIFAAKSLDKEFPEPLYYIGDWFLAA
jgi:tRNA A37 threonylcarbamoyladenosine synthetase subunit TsaC/SUA5/YrdC